MESMFSSFSSMTTSMQLAEECLRQDQEAEGVQQADDAQPFEGLEMFAQTIEAGLWLIMINSKTGLWADHDQFKARFVGRS